MGKFAIHYQARNAVWREYSIVERNPGFEGV